MTSIARRTTLLSLLSVAGGMLLWPLRLLAAWDVNAFSAATLDAALTATFGNDNINETDRIKIDIPDLVENGAVVPVQVSVELDDVRTLSIFAELNPNPLIARFHLAPRCLPAIATRIKVAAPSRIVIVAETAAGLFRAAKFVEVVEGGCG